MESIEIGFCEQCGDQIISRELTIFWRLSCLNYISNDCWISFSEFSSHYLSYLKHLEKKGLFITLDHQDLICAKPKGVNKVGENYRVCIDPDRHFSEKN